MLWLIPLYLNWDQGGGFQLLNTVMYLFLAIVVCYYPMKFLIYLPRKWRELTWKQRCIVMAGILFV